MDVMKALHEWKKGGRGETMMSTFEYKSSHDKMFIEGFRMAEMIIEGSLYEWHNLEIDPKDLPEKTGWYWCKYETGYYGKAAYTGWAGDFRDVVAWRNIPEYKGVENGRSDE